MLTPDHPDTLTGAQKAAILMLAVGEERAAGLFALLEDQEVLEVSRTMAGLGHVDALSVERLLTEFRDLMAAGGITGGVAATGKLLERSLGSERAAPIMDEIRGPAQRSVWDELAQVDDAVLAGYLANEHPQTVALIVSRLAPEQVARLLAALPEAFAADVVMRVLRLETVEGDLVVDIERALQADLASTLRQGGGRDAYGAMAAIFDNLDRATEARLMSSLEDMNKEAADRVRALMFTFEDLAKLAPAGVQMLVRAAGNDRLAVALKGASERLRDLFFANMSERAAKMLREEMQAMGPVRLKDVEEAQQLLVTMAKELASSGQIELVSDRQEEMVE